MKYITTSNKGQVTMVGVILLLIIFIVASSAAMTVVVPSAQETAEITKDKQISETIRSIPNNVNLAVGSDTPQSVTMSGEINYPYSEFVYNPPNPQINIETIDTKQTTVSATNTYTSTYDIVEFNRKYYRFTPESTKIYSQQIVYDKVKNSDTTVNPSNQYIINGDTINIYTINNKINTSNTNVEISIYKSEDVSHTNINESNNEVTITMESDLTVEQWNNLLENELNSNGGHITDISSPSAGTIQLTLESGVSYNLNEYSIELQ